MMTKCLHSANIVTTSEVCEKPLEREYIEIRLHSLNEVEKAASHGFTIHKRIVKLNDREFMCAFIRVLFADLMTLQGK